jgi:hypothetical protein
VPAFPFPAFFHDASLVSIFRTLGAGAAVVLNAVLLGRRVVVHSYKRRLATSNVASFALSTALLSAPWNLGLPADSVQRLVWGRTFPYAALAMTSALSACQSGFVAGVTNPIFLAMEDSWDVLVDLDTRSVRVSPRTPSSLPSGPHQARDAALVSAITAHIAETDAAFGSDASNPLKPACVALEYTVRAVLGSFVLNLLEMAAGALEFVGTSVALAEGHLRLDALRAESPLFAEFKANSLELPGRRYLRKLTVKDALSASETRGVLESLLAVLDASPPQSPRRDDAVCALLAQMPLGIGGLSPIAACLFHTDAEVRKAALELLLCLDDSPLANAHVGALNPVLLLTYSRCKQQAQAESDAARRSL